MYWLLQSVSVILCNQFSDKQIIYYSLYKLNAAQRGCMWNLHVNVCECV